MSANPKGTTYYGWLKDGQTYRVGTQTEIKSIDGGRVDSLTLEGTVVGKTLNV